MMSRRVNSPTSSSLASSGTLASASSALQFRQARLVEHNLGGVADLFEEPGCGFVAFGVNPGAVERMRGFGNLQEARGLRESGRADPLNLREEVPGTEVPLLLAEINDPPSRQLVQARNVPQQGNAGGIEVNSHEVDTTANDRFECFLELLGIDVMLVEADADVLGLDLDEFGERILKSAADRDGAPEGGVEFRQLVAAHLAGRVNARARLVDDHIGQLCQQVIGLVGLGWAGRRRRCRGRPGSRSARATSFVLAGAAAPALRAGLALASGRRGLGLGLGAGNFGSRAFGGRGSGLWFGVQGRGRPSSDAGGAVSARGRVAERLPPRLAPRPSVRRSKPREPQA